MSPIQATKWRHKLYKKSYTTYVANSAAKNLNWRQKLYKIRLPFKVSLSAVSTNAIKTIFEVPREKTATSAKTLKGEKMEVVEEEKTISFL